MLARPNKSSITPRKKMSGKGRGRRARRVNTNDEDSAIKVDEIQEQSDDNKSVTIEPEKSESPAKPETPAKSETPAKEETNGHETPKNTEIEEIKESKETEIVTVKSATPAPIPIVVLEKTNGQAEIIEPAADKSDKSEINKNGDEQSSEEMEPLSIDSEDPELAFVSEQNSDKSSEVEISPTLIRCKTRRSHTRNLPTPKTPKVLDFNGDNNDDKSSEKSSTKPEIPEVIITIPDDTDQSEDISLASNISIAGSVEDKTIDSELANASVFVNLGNDTTKNFDITVQSSYEEEETETEEFTTSTFLESTKDKSYGETLRCISGRKTTRHFEYIPRKFNSNYEIPSKDNTDSPRKYSTLQGIKRKSEANSSSDKRMRTEEITNPGIFSYLTSPFKHKNTSDISTSTPKLTAFKTVPSTNDFNEVSKEEIADKSTNEPRKWCTIM